MRACMTIKSSIAVLCLLVSLPVVADIGIDWNESHHGVIIVTRAR